MDLNFEIDESEVFRMLGARGKENDSIKALVCQAIKSVTENAVPRAVYRKVEREALRPLLLGHDIETHLKKCDSVVALACTLGSEIDRLIRSLQISDMALAVVVDAAASVAIESVAESLEKGIRKQLEEQGLFLTGRFSPGYGDYTISVQNGLVSFLDAQRRIGLQVTDSHLLIPRKSITALCGVSRHRVKGKLAGCEHCVLRETCTRRKEGKVCD